LPSNGISVEADGVPLIFSGYDAGLAFRPSFAPPARVLLTDRRFEMPNVILADDWHARQTAVTLQGQYHPRPGGRGWW
jgi:hypothetical protein